MISFALRGELWTDYEEKHEPEDKVEFKSARDLRQQIVIDRHPDHRIVAQKQRYMDLLREFGVIGSGLASGGLNRWANDLTAGQSEGR